MYVADDPDGQLLVAKASSSFGAPCEPVDPRRRPSRLGSFDYSSDWWNRDLSEYFDIPPGQESASSYPAMDDAPSSFAGYGSLGIAPVIVTEGVKVGTGLFSHLLNQHPQDPGRMSDNQAFYEEAVAGDADALKHLLVASGQYGADEWNRLYPGQPQVFGRQSAWATDGPRQDAWGKYQQARALLASRGAPVGQAGVPGSPNQPGLTQAGLFGALAQGGLTTYLLLGGLVAYVASRRGGRRRRR